MIPIDRLQGWLDTLKLDLDRASLQRLLPGISLSLVLLVAVGVSLSAMGLLRKLSNEQGLARVQLAGTTAREELRRLSEDTLTQARSIAGNAALRRVLQETPDLVLPLLKRACDSAGFDVCVLQRGETLLAQTQAFAELAPTRFSTAVREQGERFLLVFSDTEAPLLGASAVVLPGSSPLDNVRVYVAHTLGAKLAKILSERVAMTVQLVNYRAFGKAAVDDFTRLHSAALSDGRYAAERINDQSVFAASVPMFASTGEAIALLQVTQSTQDNDAYARQLTQRLWLTTLLVGALAVLVGWLLGRLVAEPIKELTDAATRLAQGDFSTSIPRGGPAEVGVLSRTMEDMRRNLVDLTSALRRREAEAQAVLRGTVEGVFAVDKDRRFTYLNPQAAQLLGVNAEQVIGRFCGEVLKPCTDKLGNRLCDTNCPIVQARISGHAQALEQLQLKGVTKQVVITSAGLVDGLQVQLMRDETEAEAVRRARDAVLANISHEFRTPLAAQLASIELLLDGLDQLPKDATRELVLSLERGTQRLTALIDNLLESVRIESGQLAIREQSVGIEEVVSEASAMTASLLLQRRQQLVIDVPEELPTVTGDQVRLTQVLVNLLANANKYAPEGSHITIGAALDEATTDRPQVTVWVEDEGPGVPAAQQGAIFERFVRAPEREPEPGGLGLGLWIVKSIIDRHGGVIAVTRTDTQRTRFSFTLPAEQRDVGQ